MARSSDRDADDTGTERVIVNIDGLQELTAIREALDGIRQDIDWWIKNHRPEHWLPVQPVTTMPADAVVSLPNAKGSDVQSAVTRHHAPDTVPPQPTIKTATAPNEDLDDDTHFCCHAPDLQWTGNAHFPGVACQTCGYIVADCGSVVMQSSPEADPDPEPQEQQRALFSDD